ncbi:MAG: hypothetical protein Q7R40_00340 [Phaeospirillum sp.]|nr:hypothetical protein [Phaeospirillum sp.]
MATLLRPCPECGRLMEGQKAACPTCLRQPLPPNPAPARQQVDMAPFWEQVGQRVGRTARTLEVIAIVLMLMIFFIYEFAKEFITGGAPQPPAAVPPAAASPWKQQAVELPPPPR